ncbi:DUF4214 domain-containing protein, partial [Streptococcus pneumoniae]|uniref:DUF4214 domain-containing protein n=1 Tax=Streptococcus pneumoniae TaxID=1313 RepID=UPI0013DBEFCD
DGAGLAGWVATLDSGTSRGAVAVGFTESIEEIAKTQAASEGYATSTLHSAEYGQVFRVYQALLGHSPDAASYDS